MSASRPQPHFRRLTPNDWAVVACTLLYIAPAFVISLNRSNSEFLIYVAVLVVLLACVLFLHLKVKLHPVTLWGLSLWGLAHMCGGLMPIPSHWPIGGETHVLYNWWIIPERLKFDQLVHAYGFGLVTWVCWQGLKKAFQDHNINQKPTFGLLTLCAAAGVGFGALNEVVEFFATLALPETNVGGYLNTGWDLVFNLLGSLVAAIAIGIREGRPTAQTATTPHEPS